MDWKKESSRKNYRYPGGGWYRKSLSECRRDVPGPDHAIILQGNGAKCEHEYTHKLQRLKYFISEFLFPESGYTLMRAGGLNE